MNSLIDNEAFEHRADRIAPLSADRGISAFVLKIAAIIGMTANHVANVFPLYMPAQLTVFLYGLGGLTYPIFAFLLVEGYRYTHNIKRYFLRLLVFAIIAQVPYSLLWGDTFNVLFTLLIGLFVVYALDAFKNKLIAIAILAIAVFATQNHFDWGGIGVALAVLFYGLRLKSAGLGRWGIVIAMAVLIVLNGFPYLSYFMANINVPLVTVPTPVPDSSANMIVAAGSIVTITGCVAYYFGGSGLATVLMVLHNGKRGIPLKWFFYAYYPAHLFVIWLIKVLFFT